MKDDEYFGFSANDDFNGVNLRDDGETFEIVDLVDFDREDDVRIVSLDDVEQYMSCSSQQSQESRRSSSLECVTPGEQKAHRLPTASALRQRCTRKRNLVKSGVVAGLVVVVLLIFLSNSPLLSLKRGSGNAPVSNASSSASAVQLAPAAPILSPPPKAVPLIIDIGHYYIELNPNWTQVMLDGYPLRYLPIPGIDPPLHMSLGQHHIVWETSSSRSYGCTMSVPPTLTDTCVYHGPEPLQNGVSVWIIALPHFNDGD